MSRELPFMVYCIERYRHEKGLSGADAARLFEKHGVFSYLETSYEALHTTGEQYIIQDIDEYIMSTSCS